MPYTTNPRAPRLRARAVHMVRAGKSVSEVARYFGYTKGCISKWCKKMRENGSWVLETVSSRPRHHPHKLSDEVVHQILECKKKRKRCSEVIHQHLKNEGVVVSLSSVKRTLDKAGLIKKRSPWKRLHLSVERPLTLAPGDLVLVDTIHLMVSEKQRIYVYTLIDVYSRWCFAWATDRISTRQSVKFLQMAQDTAPFQFACVQSDHGSEFSQHFSERIKVLHRHSRVRKPNDNAYLERFNRTLQEECLTHFKTNVKIFNRQLPVFLNYYNDERLHMGINFQTPNQMLKRFQAIG